MKKKLTSYLFLIGIILFLAIVWTIGIDKILATILGVDLFYFAIALVFVLLLLAIKAMKWKILLEAFDVNISFIDIAKLWLIGFFLGFLSPGKVGDFYRARYLKQDTGLSTGKSFASVMVERILDIFFLFIAGFVGLIIFSFSFQLQESMLFLVVAFFLAFVAVVYLLTRRKLLSTLARPFFNRFVPEEYKDRLKGSYNEFFEGLKVYKGKKSILVKAVILLLISWVLNFVQVYFIALAFGINVSFEFLSLILPILFLVEILPISFSGLGTRDAAAIFFLGFKLVPAELAVSFSLGIVIVNLFSALLGLGFFNLRKMKEVQKPAQK
ncbi:MAG: lysylphosphatidylglycerol synthase transmembrane domain-containing protein [Candidatus Diapherotrites archaeon]